MKRYLQLVVLGVLMMVIMFGLIFGIEDFAGLVGIELGPEYGFLLSFALPIWLVTFLSIIRIEKN